jgi:fructokinase
MDACPMPRSAPLIFGEALFDCFEDGTEILGGAPFNVAWHLQALGDAPLFISRVGDDERGARIRTAMTEWGMSTAALQTDYEHPTGQVLVQMQSSEPHYTICENMAYDFIDASSVASYVTEPVPLLYHGTLALRHSVSRQALQTILHDESISVFMDINLRTPWWENAAVHGWLQHARWCKLNQQEMTDIGFCQDTSNSNNLKQVQERFNLEQVILTRGDAGAIVREADGQTHEQRAITPARIIDSVGAGDAFSAMYIHGLLAGWSIPYALNRAQQFASAMLGQRGGIVQDPAFYDAFR